MLYVIGSKEDWRSFPIKIGFTDSSPEERLSSIQTGSPHKLDIIRTLEGEKKDEKEIHRALKEYRLNGEWFDTKTIPSELVNIFLTSNSAKKIINAFKEVGYEPSKTWTAGDLEKKIVDSVTQKFLEFKKKNPMVDIENSALWVVRYDRGYSGCTTMRDAIPSGVSDRKLKNTLKKLRSKGVAQGLSWEIHFDAEAHTKNIFEYTSSVGIKLKSK